MITVHVDLTRMRCAESGPYVWTGDDVADYVELRQRIRQALDDRYHNYTIHIHDRTLARWLGDLYDYDSQEVRWQETTPRGEFERRFGFAAPAELGDADIVSLHLLDLPEPVGAETSDPTGWLLGRCLDRVWGFGTPDSGHFVDLVAWLHSNAESIDPRLLPLARTRIAHWTGIDDNYSPFMHGDWKDTADRVLTRWALRSYPPSLQLRKELAPVPLVECSNYPYLCAEALEGYAEQLSKFWNTWLASDPPDALPQTLEWMSGLVVAELDAFEEWARQHPDKITGDLVFAVRQKFVRLPQSSNALKRIEERVRPDMPATPDVSWSVSDWLRWATNDYIPFFRWLHKNGQHDPVQVDLSGRYADWLIKTYPNLLDGTEAALITNQYAEVRDAVRLARVDVALWIIVDCMTWWHAQYLYRKCAELGLGVTRATPAISALPSVTYISKRALVQGILDHNTVGQSIAQVLTAKLEGDGVRAHACTQKDEFRAALAGNIECGVYAWFYGAVDDLSHKTKAFTDDREFLGPLDMVAEVAWEGLVACQRRGLRAVAFVSSDHGSTKLPADCPVLKAPPFAHELDDYEEHEEIPAPTVGRAGRGATTTPDKLTRACSLDRLPTESEREHLERQWHVLHKDVFGLHQHFLIPKGYAAIGRRPSGWTHGGATPEETVIAFIELQPHAVEVQAPDIRVDGELVSGQPTTLNVIITNYNRVPLQQVRLWVSAADMVPIQDIGPISPQSISIEARVTSAKGDTYPLDWSLICEVAGREEQFDGRVEVPMRRMFTSDFDEWFSDEE